MKSHKICLKHLLMSTMLQILKNPQKIKKLLMLRLILQHLEWSPKNNSKTESQICTQDNMILPKALHKNKSPKMDNVQEPMKLSQKANSETKQPPSITYHSKPVPESLKIEILLLKASSKQASPLIPMRDSPNAVK